MDKILISACLAGVNCKYDGKNNLNEKILKLVKSGQAVLVCPEQSGGLPTPRTPCEIIDDKIISARGEDVTAQFHQGAKETLRLTKLYGIKTAILKERSPSCGVHSIYDGSFTNTIIPGNGITTRLLQANGINIISDEEF
jgi:uncharacterized protein YbbK (DUF523 family)